MRCQETHENLTYDDGSFDIVIVHAGLHHCQSPHRALLEMYRVARKCAVAFESRDSLLMRAAVSLGLTESYEVSAISLDGKNGGVADTGTPNFIYRWTERDVRNTIASYDPARIPQIKFFYDLRIPIQRFTRTGNHAMRIVGYLSNRYRSFWPPLPPDNAMSSHSLFQKAAACVRGLDNPHDVFADDGGLRGRQGRVKRREHVDDQHWCDRETFQPL
jgi:SAM-dependent methyltransferase